MAYITPTPSDVIDIFKDQLPVSSKELTSAEWEKRKDAIKRGDFHATDADKARMDAEAKATK